jgi:hypothetical protein
MTKLDDETFVARGHSYRTRFDSLAQGLGNRPGDHKKIVGLDRFDLLFKPAKIMHIF